MRKNTMKEKLAAGQPVVGFNVMYDWPEIVQMCGHLGADFAIFDGEHGYLGTPEIARLIRAAESVNITPIARVPRNAADVILAFLDAGAHGIVIPNVSTAQEAEEAVRSVKYYPEGQRGTGYGHSMEWMINQPFSEYVKEANVNTMVFPQCESEESVKNLEEILQVPGVDGIMVGPNDLAQSLGFPGKLDHPEVQKALEYIKRTVIAAGKYLALPAIDGDAAHKAIAEGAHMINIGAHRMFIAAAREYLKKTRAENRKG